MNVFELLMQDHRKVDNIFSQMEQAGEGNKEQLETLFAQLRQELQIHTHIEETFLYPALKKDGETRETTLEGFEEHHVVKLLLRELEPMKVGSEQWMAKLKVLKENVEHHVEEEENELFESARNVLSEEQINHMGMQMQAEKENAQKSASAAGGIA